MNRLDRERSPYLLQHAHNPVDWFPWGDEAFAKARAEDKPIFLSVGYSTCHWCHVMAHESFADAEIARALNEHFVSIKVDREERPDVDRVYMAFVQATTGSGGWPMSVWLTPELEPFYGGTYFPPSSRWGRPGFLEILQEIANVWRSDRAKVRESAEAVVRQLKSMERQSAGTAIPDAQSLRRTVDQFREAFDRRLGGFGDAPKFPRPAELLFLLREYARTGDREALDMTLATLRAMALGGLRDHVGGGFHRYSVDAAWRVPHFEKMLYDQAQLTLAYVEGAQASGDDFFREVAEDTLLYVMREMTDEGGGFHSAEDADSIPPEKAGEGRAHKSEGAFYLWRAEEIDALLGADAPIVRLRFGIQANGNAPADPQGEFVGKNLLYVAHSVDEISEATGRSRPDVVDVLQRARLRLFEERLRRPRPHRDDKVLTAWNGLMIAAFARVARVIAGQRGDRAAGEPYLRSARRAAAFVRERMWSDGSRTLLRRSRGGHADIEAYAEDYAYFTFGLLELFQADPDPGWLEWAIVLQHRQDELFWDEREGGWFSTTGRDPSVLLRVKEEYDGAEPTASSVSVLNLIVLSHLIDDRGWRDQIDRTLKFFGGRLAQLGRGVPMMAAALSTFMAGTTHVIIINATDDDSSLARALASRYLPFAIRFEIDGESQQRLAGSLPFIAPMRAVDNRSTAYVCRDFVCRQPATSIADLEHQL
jgi:uncharacterized protein YyaL (SSP411 family)